MDLLSQENIEEFKSALTDVFDTFFKYPVVVVKDGVEIDLLCGMQEGPGKNSESGGELLEIEDSREEINEIKTLKFYAGYLKEKGVSIDYDCEVYIDNKGFTITRISEKGYFRDSNLLVVVEVAR